MVLRVVNLGTSRLGNLAAAAKFKARSFLLASQASPHEPPKERDLSWHLLSTRESIELRVAQADQDHEGNTYMLGIH